ncbi:zinc finger protein 490-like [Armigeres subalbatus]|uniref:zinc finger protein 490-like n=1 Tax=Armigeres subalbatus TaxID=124917 RepID=UPI002ED24B38
MRTAAAKVHQNRKIDLNRSSVQIVLKSTLYLRLVDLDCETQRRIKVIQMSFAPQAEYRPPADTVLSDEIKEEPSDRETDPFELCQTEEVKMDLMESIGEVPPDPIGHQSINSVDVDGGHHPINQTVYENNPKSTRCRFCFNLFHEVGGRAPISLKRVIFVLGLPKGKLLELNPECCMCCKEMFDQSFEFKRLCLAALARSMDCADWTTKEDEHDTVETQSSSSENSTLEEGEEEPIVSEEAIISTASVATLSTPPTEGSQLDNNTSRIDCQMCNETFFEWSDLEKHWLTHFSTSTENIHVTNPITSVPNDQQVKSKKAVQLYCYRCTKWYPTKLIYDEHKEKCVALFEGKQTLNTEYYCFRCNKWFSSKDVFTIHKISCKNASEGGALQKPELSEANALPVCNESPIGQPWNGGFFCTRCRTWYQSKLIFTDHVPLCNRATGKELKNLLSNLQPASTAQPEPNGILRPKRIRISARVEQPVVVTPVVEEHPCNRCKQIFATKKLYSHHWKSCLQEKLYSCQQCPLKFNTEARLIVHTERHTGERNYPCREGCGKMLTYTTRYNHERRCGKEIRVLCSICGAVFRSDNALHVHMATHGNPLFSCKLCDKSFHTKSRLKKHGGVHTDARNFECKVCGKRFKSHEANRVHQRIHTQEKPYVCSICGTAFTYNCLLKTHMEKGHESTNVQQPSEKSQSLVHSDGEPKD